MIKPTVGRRVWYRPAKADAREGFVVLDPAQPCDAGIAFVHGDRLVNITVADHRGVLHSMSEVKLLQDDDKAPEGRHYCEWMPFQKGQSAAADTKGLPGAVSG